MSDSPGDMSPPVAGSMGQAIEDLNADVHYHHLTDDIIKGGKMKYRGGKIDVPQGPGLGVELDRDKLAEYAKLYKELGGYAYDRDPARPGWYAIFPEQRHAVPRRR